MSSHIRRSLSDKTVKLIDATRGFMAKEEGLELFRIGSLAPLSPSHPIVEVGSWAGKSTLYLGEAARGRGTVLAVDHHYGSEENYPPFPYSDERLVDPHSHKIDTARAFRRTIELAELTDVVIGVVGDSSSFADAVSVSPSMVFIDGGHGTLPAWMDYLSWSNRVIPGGFLAIHDVFEDPQLGGRPPYQIATAAAHTKEFEPFSVVGSLVVLRHRG